MTDPARTLDDYFDALGIASYRGPVVLSQVVTSLFGRQPTRAEREETERALDELVAQGRAERDPAGRYQLVRSAVEEEPEQAPEPEVDAWEDDGGATTASAPESEGEPGETFFATGLPPGHVHTASAIAAMDAASYKAAFPPPDLGSDPAVDTWADDGGAPPAPDPVTYTEPEVHPEAEVPVRHCPVVGRADSDREQPEIVQPELSVPAEALQTIEDVAARHAPRPELASVEAVLEEASALRKRTEVALAVAKSDVAEANAREATARSEHETAFRAAKEKAERLRQVQDLATRLGVEAGAPA